MVKFFYLVDKETMFSFVSYEYCLAHHPPHSHHPETLVLQGLLVEQGQQVCRFWRLLDVTLKPVRAGSHGLALTCESRLSRVESDP